MSAPSQVFPPWLTPVPITTEIDGVPVVETSIKFIPLTYFGPSIPLGSVFTFGGSTFPPTVVFGPQSSTSTINVSPTSSSPSSTVIPTLTSTPSVSTSTISEASSKESTTPSTQSTTSGSTSSTQATSSSPVATSPRTALASSRGLGTKLAIGLSIGIVAILLVILLLVFLRVRRRRSLRSINRLSDDDWQIVGSPDSINRDGATEAHEGEVLLPEERVMRQRASLSSTPVLIPWMRRAYEPVASAAAAESGTRSSQNSAGSAAEGVASSSQANASLSTIAPGALFYNPVKSRDDDAARNLEEGAGQSSLLRERSSSPSGASKDYARLPPGASPPLLPQRSYGKSHSFLGDNDQFIPPGVFFDNTPRSKSRHHSTDSLPYPESPPSETDERATLLTAQRVDLGPQVSVSAVSHQRHSPDDHAESSAVGTSLAGLSGLTRLSRFSWLRRLQNDPSSGHFRHSSPLPGDELHRTSSFNRLSFHPASRPHSALLYPGHGSRPGSDFSYVGLADNELGLRPPAALLSVRQSSGSRGESGNGSGSGRSGQTVYHSARSRPSSFYPRPASDLPAGGALIDIRSGEDSATAAPVGDTIRTVDVLDMPVPEPKLPLQAALWPDNVLAPSSSSSAESPRFPPGLVVNERWDSDFPSSQGEGDILDQAPPRSPGEWSSMKSRRSPTNSPVERELETEHNVEVTSLRGPMSEEAVVESYFLGSPNTPGFSLTPRVSLHTPSERISHHSGSHSSRPSDHTTFTHEHETQPSYNDPLSDDEYHPPAIQRASLSAIGGHDSSGRYHHVRKKSSAIAGRVLPAPEERTSEEEKSGTGSRPVSLVSGGSRQTASETVVSRSTGNNPAGGPSDSVEKGDSGPETS